MEQWFYEDSGQQRGPVDELEIRSLLESGKIRAQTLVWKKEMADWKAAGTLDEFKVARETPVSQDFPVSPYAPPTAGPEAGIDLSGYEPSGPQVRPWVRYFARTSDYFFFSMTFGGIAMMLVPALAEMNDNVLGLLSLFIYNFIEPVMLAVFGTTPFKALLGVRVRNQDGSKLSYGRGLRRTFLLWFRGVGLGIPLVGLFTCIHSYKVLNRDGITSWDADGNFSVTHKEIKWWQWLILGVIAVGFARLMALGLEHS